MDAVAPEHFRGKAQGVFSVMSLEHNSQYDLIKKAVLKVYELVPEPIGRTLEIIRK